MARVGFTCLMMQRRFARRFADQNERMFRFFDKMLKDQSTAIERVLTPTAIVSKGVPLTFRGNAKTLKRRQAVLNKNFMETVSEIMTSTPFGHEINDLNVILTQVEISSDYRILNIYWSTSSDKNNNQILAISKKLQSLTGRLNKLIQEKKFMEAIPNIRFVFDRHVFAKKEVENLLEKVDLGPNFSATDPTTIETPSERLTKSKGRFKTDVSTYIKDTEDIKYTPEPSVLTFKCPGDMRLDTLGLDYRNVVNKVLFYMKKSRAEHRNFNAAVADPLPPAEWVAPPILQVPPEMEESEAESMKIRERVKAMKMFIIENRKKRQRLRKEAIKREDERFELANEAMDEAIDNCMQQMLNDATDYEYYDECDEEQ